MLLPALLEVRITVSPEQIEVGPLAEITGTGVTVTITVEEFGEVHPFTSVTFTKNEPGVLTISDWVVEPSDQRFPVELFEVSVTLSPAQIFVEPEGVMVGVAGI